MQQFFSSFIPRASSSEDRSNIYSIVESFLSLLSNNHEKTKKKLNSEEKNSKPPT